MMSVPLLSFVVVTALTVVAAPAGPVPTLALTIEVTVSDKATEEVAARGQRLTVVAAYNGEPTYANRKNTALDGQINLGHAEVFLPPSGGEAEIDGDVVDRKRLGLIKGEPLVNVNVYSAGRDGPDNVIDCGIYEGGVPARGPRTIACKLIGEDG